MSDCPYPPPLDVGEVQSLGDLGERVNFAAAEAPVVTFLRKHVASV